MSDIAVNPARALHNVLERMLASGQGTINAGWTAVLGIGPGSIEFVQRHSELSGLVATITARLHALPEGNRTRARSLHYVPSWYEAVVTRADWNSGNYPAQKIIHTSSLHQLEGLADWLDLADSPPVLTDDAIEQLRDALDEWRNLLDEAGLPDSLANEIRSQVEHIDWMLTNIGLVGTQSIVDRTRQLAGTGIDAMAARPSMAKRFGVVIAMVVGIIASVNQGVGDAQGILDGAREMAATVQDIGANGFAKPKELTSVPDPIPSEVLDGEVVEAG